MIGNQLKGFRDFPDKSLFLSTQKRCLLIHSEVAMTGLCQEKGTMICHVREI